MQDSRGRGFDATMIAIDGLMSTDHGIGVLPGFPLGHEQADIVAQRALIALEGEDMVGLLVDDLLRDRTLAAHGVDGHDRPLDRQHLQKVGDRDDLVRASGEKVESGFSLTRRVKMKNLEHRAMPTNRPML